MRLTFIVLLLSFQLGWGQASNQADTAFVSKRLSKTATITINAKPQLAFSMFGAFEEKKWAEHWNPMLIYPTTEVIGEGTVFKTKTHSSPEKEFLWYVTKYDSASMITQYLVSTANRCWTITVKCTPAPQNKTRAEITYTFTGLNKKGNDMNSEALNRMYGSNLQDWQTQINSYLQRAQE